jgi:hypothetical protein
MAISEWFARWRNCSERQLVEADGDQQPSQHPEAERTDSSRCCSRRPLPTYAPTDSCDDGTLSAEVLVPPGRRVAGFRHARCVRR